MNAYQGERGLRSPTAILRVGGPQNHEDETLTGGGPAVNQRGPRTVHTEPEILSFLIAETGRRMTLNDIMYQVLFSMSSEHCVTKFTVFMS